MSDKSFEKKIKKKTIISADIKSFPSLFLNESRKLFIKHHNIEQKI